MLYESGEAVVHKGKAGTIGKIKFHKDVFYYRIDYLEGGCDWFREAYPYEEELIGANEGDTVFFQGEMCTVHKIWWEESIELCRVSDSKILRGSAKNGSDPHVEITDREVRTSL